MNNLKCKKLNKTSNYKILSTIYNRCTFSYYSSKHQVQCLKSALTFDGRVLRATTLNSINNTQI